MTSKAADGRLLATTSSIAVATLTSRITGFAKQVAVLVALGKYVASSFTVASQIPNMISEFVLGAVLTQVVVPVLIRSEEEDPDGGAMFIRRLFAAALVVLGGAALIATLSAPLLTKHVFLDPNGLVDTAMTTTLSYLLLPGIMFYGLTALFTAILNTRTIFKPGAWAPVLNNVVVLVVLGIVAIPTEFGRPELYLLGLGVLFGVVSQVLLLFFAIRRAGVSLRPQVGAR